MSQKIIKAKEGATVKWEVARSGYVTQKGSHVMKAENHSISIQLVEEPKSRFTINPTPTTAVVEFTITSGTGTVEGNTVIASIGSEIHWNVSAEGFVTQEGDKVIGNADESLTVELITAGPVEEFKFTINSGSDSSFILPLSSTYSIENNLTAYNMNVDWGDGQVETITGNVSNGHGVTHPYASPNQDYEITLTPAGDEDGWMCGLGFYVGEVGCNVSTNRAKVKKLSSPYTEKMIIRGGNVNYILANVWVDCTGLITIETEFNLPQTITKVGHGFCSHMFSSCSSLQTLPEGFNFPQGITTVRDGFLSYMFSNCKSLTTLPEGLNLPQNITYVGYYFCREMFRGCSNLEALPVGFTTPQKLTHVNIYFCAGMFQECSSLVTIPSSFSIPRGLVSCESYFFRSTFQDCSGLKTGITAFFGDFILSEGSLNVGAYCWCFGNCISLMEEISPETIPQLTILPNYKNACFKGCPSDKIANCPPKWKTW